MTRRTLTTLAFAMALFSLAGAKEQKFVDNRDGKVYATTKIGKQVWMAENLNYAADSSWCYKDDPVNCKKYGRLYTWNAAMKACPTGWHLPTREEWDALGNAIGKEAGTKLKSKEWGGSDAVGFNALPAGGRGDDGAFDFMGAGAYFWTATEYGGYDVPNIILSSTDTWLDKGRIYKNFAHSVRCVKD